MSDFNFHTPDTATGEAKQLLQEIEKNYGFIPNLFAYIAESPATLKAYLQLNALLQETSFTNAQLQVALLAVSLQNECDFCAAAHQFMAKKFSAKSQTIVALIKQGPIDDESDRILVETVRAVVLGRGWVDKIILDAFYNAGFTHKHYLELMIIVSIKTLSNYINHQTQPEINPELKAT